jgi:hypothetical protein
MGRYTVLQQTPWPVLYNIIKRTFIYYWKENIKGEILMIFETNQDKGRAGISMAIAYFGANGYTVSIPLNDTQWYDLIVEKDGIFQTV